MSDLFSPLHTSLSDESANVVIGVQDVKASELIGVAVVSCRG